MESVIEHLNRYIPQLGYSNFIWRPRKVVLNEQTPKTTIMAQNEYWYLKPQSVIEGLKIFADNDYIITDATTTAEPEFLVKPLTGQIDISVPVNSRQVLVFIQVIPQI